MNTPEDTEQLLQQLSPSATDLSLRDRVAEDLDLDQSWAARVHRAPKWVVASGWAGMGAAAAVAVMALLSSVAPQPQGGGLANQPEEPAPAEEEIRPAQPQDWVPAPDGAVLPAGDQ